MRIARVLLASVAAAGAGAAAASCGGAEATSRTTHDGGADSTPPPADGARGEASCARCAPADGGSDVDATQVEDAALDGPSPGDDARAIADDSSTDADGASDSGIAACPSMGIPPVTCDLDGSTCRMVRGGCTCAPLYGDGGLAWMCIYPP
jgi:hypothetical protein